MGLSDDIKKTVSFARRNGVTAAIAAARERIALNRVPYAYEELPESAVKEQRADFSRLVMEAGAQNLPRFSVVVPAYRTPVPYLRQMIDSVKRQTYGAWELIVADASPASQRLEKEAVEAASDARMRYVHLSENRGIAENTNEAMLLATGDYIVLLDHDDLLTADALYELARRILPAEKQPVLLYSDEDKFAEEEADGKPDTGQGNGSTRRYFEPHRKDAFDFEKLLSNNYVCHLCAIRADIARKFPMRSAYDGAQDHELTLRIACETIFGSGDNALTVKETQQAIVHIPRVLYHWRAHAGSTASDPAHKRYAFDAGKRAIADVMKDYGFRVTVKELPHLGFFRTTYPDGIFEERADVGVIGGRVTDKNGTVLSGKMDEEGHAFFEGMTKGESGGYQHPAVLIQEADTVDLRCIRVRDELLALYASYAESDLTDEEEAIGQSVRFCKAVRAEGYRILYDPQMEVKNVTESDSHHSQS